MHKFEELPEKALARWESKAGKSKDWAILKTIAFGTRDDIKKLIKEDSNCLEKAEWTARLLYSKQEKFVIEIGEGTNQSLFSYVTENLVEKMQEEYLLLKEKMDLPPETMITESRPGTNPLKAYHKILVAAMTSMAEAYISELKEEENLPKRYKGMEEGDIVNAIFLGKTNGHPALISHLMSWADPEEIDLDESYLRGKIIGTIIDRLKKDGKKEDRLITVSNEVLEEIPQIDENELRDRGSDYYERFERFVDDVVTKAVSETVLSKKQKDLLKLIIEMQAEREDKTFPSKAEIAEKLGCSDENVSQRLGRIAARIVVGYGLDRDIVARNFGLSVRAIQALERTEGRVHSKDD